MVDGTCDIFHCWESEFTYEKKARMMHGVKDYSWRCWYELCFSSVQFSGSVVSNSLRPNESQHTRPSCPSPTPRVHLNSRPLSRWCHPAISSSVVPFSSCLQSLPASESFPMSQLFAWGGQSTGVSATVSKCLFLTCHLHFPILICPLFHSLDFC